MSIWVGIDVSKETLDLAWYQQGRKFHEKVANSKEGFEKLLALVPEEALFLMESTGVYHVNLALHLHRAGRHVSVVNAWRIKAHIQTELSRMKSDKADAFAIARFGAEKNPEPWAPPRPEVAELQNLLALDEHLAREIVRLKNLAHAICATELASLEALLRTRKIEKRLSQERRDLQKEIERLARRAMPREVELLSSVAGVGEASAIRVAAAVGDFHRFSTSRKLASFIGITPTRKQSGTSLHSNGSISRMGGARIRGALYMCALSAVRHNPQCRAMWKRMKEEKKRGKVIIVAVMNKLIRQMHAMVVQDRFYDPSWG